jgi:hypothetical protein
MGFYLNSTGTRDLPNKGKVDVLVKDCSAEILVIPPPSLDVIPEDKAVICVIDNDAFEAAELVYDDMELRECGDQLDDRVRVWLLMDKELTHKLTGYSVAQTNA